jgi:hypothetical protein
MNFALFDQICLGIIFSISPVIIYEDIRWRHIRNLWILALFLLGAGLLAVAYMRGAIDLIYLTGVLLNTAFAFVAGFVIWRLGFWPAGDSKLFVVFSFLLPLQYYWKTYLYFFPSFVLLINSFVLFLIFLLVKAILLLAQTFVLSFKNKTWSLGKMPTWLMQGRGMLCEVVGNSQKRNRFLVNLLFSLTISTLIYVLFSIILTKQSFHPGRFLIYYMVFLLMSILLDYYTDHYAKLKIPVANLKPCCNLSDGVIEQLQTDQALMRNLGTLRAEGITADQARLIKDYFLVREVREIEIMNTIPFSPWIVGGVLTTIAFKGNLVQLITSLF